MALSLQTVGLLVLTLATAGYALYRAALPKPIPGIPYDRKSASQILGDVPEALKYHADTSEMMTFLEKKCVELGSPIAQVFMRPFARPWVVLLDSRESQDIMARRGREFDRSDFFGDLLISLFPLNQVSMRTNDQWRHNRRLMGDAMAPQFLNNVAAPRVYESTLDLLDLWRQKIRVAKGHVIDVSKDISYCTVDTIWAATFGTSVGACKSQSLYLSGMDVMRPAAASPDAVTRIPVQGLSATYSALETIAVSSEIPMNSPLGRRHHWFAMNFIPHYRRAMAKRDGLIRAHVQRAWKTFDNTSDSMKREAQVKCVVDLVVERESTLSRKQNKEPERESRVLHDELAGFLGAGFETTSSSIRWGLKYLTKHQDVQQKLRHSLAETLPEAANSGCQPSPKDIAEAHIPYLDAFIDEVLRHSSIIPANIRMATSDTQVLGYHVPKGTDVFMLTTGPSFRSPAMKIDENQRSNSSRHFKADADRWNEHTDIHEFKPERWLVKNVETGSMDFDPRAAPMQQFGAGVRGCFGKKLAYLEMRTIYTLILLNFEFRTIPSALSDFKAADIVTHQPQNVRVILKEVK